MKSTDKKILTRALSASKVSGPITIKLFSTLDGGRRNAEVMTDKKEIRFAWDLWQQSSDSIKYRTMFHELCHIEARRVDPKCPFVHGPAWDHAMIEGGFGPWPYIEILPTGRIVPRIGMKCVYGEWPKEKKRTKPWTKEELIKRRIINPPNEKLMEQFVIGA